MPYSHPFSASLLVLQWFAVAFLGHWVGLIAIAGTYGPGFVSLVNQNLTVAHSTDNTRTLTADEQNQVSSVIGILCVAAIIGSVFAALFLWLMKRAQGRVVKLSLALNLLLDGVATVVCFAVGAVPLGVIFIVYFVILCVWAYMVRKRIPFAEAVLTAASHVPTQQSHTESGTMCFVAMTGRAC